MLIIHQELNRFMKSLMTHLKKHYIEDYFIGNIYSDEKNIVYFSFTPKELREQKLKIAIVYNLKLFRFEIWLAGQNKQIQKKYWEIFKDSDWDKYHIPSSITDGFSIVDSVIIEKPDFSNFELMIEEIETKSLEFIKSIVDVLKL
jgi:AraC family transcriptional regulator